MDLEILNKDKKRHLNFIISSYLIFGMGGITLIRLIYFPYLRGEDIAIIFINLVLYIGLGFLLRQTYIWIKYLLLLLAIISLINNPRDIVFIPENLNGLVQMVQRIIFLSATGILFIDLTSVKETDSNLQNKK